MSLARAIRTPTVVSRSARSTTGRATVPAARNLPLPTVRAPLAPPAPQPVAAVIPANTAAEIEFWEVRYKTNRTPWDPGRSPVALLQWLERNPPKRRTALIPGAGRGHEIFSFSGSGWNTTAIDLSPTATEKAKRRANRALAKQIHCGDFFAHHFSGPSLFDVIYERAFLCSLPPARRQEYIKRVISLLKPGGLLMGYFFYGDRGTEPPHGLTTGEEQQLIAPHFVLTEDAPVSDSLPLFLGKERWQVWQKR